MSEAEPVSPASTRVERMPGAPWWRLVWWDVSAFTVGTILRIFYRFHVEGIERLPESGALIYVGNHSSFLDPIAGGIAIHRRGFTAMARESLYRVPFVGWAIKGYGGVGLKGTASDKSAMKKSLEELAAGRCVIIYPEGTRSEDGRVYPFKSGAALLLRRADATVVPIIVEGAFDIWPRTRKFPGGRGRLWLQIGEPRHAKEVLADGAAEGLERLRAEIDEIRLDMRRRMREHTNGKWPLPGPADQPSIESIAREAASPAPATTDDGAIVAGDDSVHLGTDSAAGTAGDSGDEAEARA